MSELTFNNAIEIAKDIVRMCNEELATVMASYAPDLPEPISLLRTLAYQQGANEVFIALLKANLTDAEKTELQKLVDSQGQ